MKRLLTAMVLIFFMFSHGALSQTATEYIVTEQDVQICFPYTDGGGTVVRQWYSPEGSAITYSTEPVEMHVPKAKLGTIRFEGLLQDGEPALGKAVMDISVTSLPAPDRRTMEFRFRVRSIDGSVISPWSDAIEVHFIGKPGTPAHVEIPVNRS